jgi:hypothetical protein
MSRRLLGLVYIGAAMFVVGWALVLISGYGGDSTGNFGGLSELVWRSGGVILYVSSPVMLTAPMLQVVGHLRSAARRHADRA